MRRWDPEELTPTEAAAQAAIRRDPLRKMTDSELERQYVEAQWMSRLYAGTREAWRCDQLHERMREIRKEQARRRAAA